MAKVTINGEVFQWDASRRPMSEALALEEGLKCTFAKWEEDMAAGSARAMCGFIWLVWRRDGRDVALADILSGEVEIDLNDLNIEPEEGDVDPTTPPPGASSTTAGVTSASSRNGSQSGRGRSSSSTRATSRRSSTTSKTQVDEARIAELERELGIGDPAAAGQDSDVH